MDRVLAKFDAMIEMCAEIAEYCSEVAAVEGGPKKLTAHQASESLKSVIQKMKDHCDRLRVAFTGE